MTRPVLRYEDPLELIWRGAARELGFTVRRSEEAFAAYDGAGELLFSTSEHLDEDDCLGQLIFHELCHALVEGPGALRRRDWGLENQDARHLVREQACHRLQAALADRYGLRRLLAVTTDDWRHYAELSEDPLQAQDPSEEEAVRLARDAWHRARMPPWGPALHQALSATASLAAALAPLADEDSLWSKAEPLHPLGGGLGPSEQRCRDCAWSQHEEGRWGCLQHGGAQRDQPLPVEPDWPACRRWESPLDSGDCARCGACCHRGFDRVELEESEPFLQRHPDWIQEEQGLRWLPRPGGLCVALEPGPPWRCRDYEQRPQSCRELPVGGASCLLARQRAGLSQQHWPGSG